MSGWKNWGPCDWGDPRPQVVRDMWAQLPEREAYKLNQLLISDEPEKVEKGLAVFEAHMNSYKAHLARKLHSEKVARRKKLEGMDMKWLADKERLPK